VTTTVDYAVIGGGIVGMATAMTLLERHPAAEVVVLEKEEEVATHQTGHNSGVIHAGIYYTPGSLKARLCRAGEVATKAFCQDHGIPFATAGKLVVATDEQEVSRLQVLHERGQENGILGLEPVDARRLAVLEPNIAGLEALLVPSTGIVDYRRVVEAMRRVVDGSGGEVRTGETVTGITEQDATVRVTTEQGSVSARYVVACAGLQADRVARLGGIEPDFRIVPFRGEYFELPPSRRGMVRHLIYPVPDPELPFLGVHLSPTIDGRITVGPNAVLGLAREGYRKSQVSLRDVGSFASFPGTWRMAATHLRAGLVEMKNSLSRRGYLELCRTYCPDLAVDDLLPHPAGIRAQAVMRDGQLVHDFLIRRTRRQLHVANAPSPAATSAIPIAGMIADHLAQS
jgi:L-2-hydroxyglutarate oxidase